MSQVRVEFRVDVDALARDEERLQGAVRGVRTETRRAESKASSVYAQAVALQASLSSLLLRVGGAFRGR